LSSFEVVVNKSKSILAIGTVPLAKSDASKFVKFAPLIAGRVAGNLASGTVPEDKLSAFKEDPSMNPLSLLNPEILIFAFC
jgi:hypothetical protein